MSGPSPSTERVYAQEEFFNVERFGDVVVSTGMEAGDAVVHGAESGQEQHRGGLAVRSQCLHYVATVRVGESHIHHDHLDAAGRAKESQRFSAIVRAANGVSGGLQGAGDKAADGRVVLAQSDQH